MADQMPIIPEVYEPDEKLPPDLVALRRFAFLMDEAVAVPGTRQRVGIDAGLSLIPGVGEVIGAFFSAWIVVGAVRHRVPFGRVAKMVAYVLLDMVVGAVPILGTIFDWLFPQSTINLEALLRYRDRSRPPRSIGEVAGTAIAIFVIIFLVALLLLGFAIAIVFWLINQRNAVS
jgi:hypothetical protein